MANIVTVFLIGLGVVIVSAIVYRVAIQNFCYSAIAENASILACGAIFAGSFLMFYALPSLIGELAKIIGI